jgi:pimeloyl-ACP methyl ester carboxylesterase
MKINLIKQFIPVVMMAGFAACGTETGQENKSTDSTATAETKTDSIPTTDTIQVHGTLEFSAADGLAITADSYEILPGEKYILLCHQADYSRGEYIETAKKLNDLGFNCLAIDQRSGRECNSVMNETAKRAKEKKIKADYLDAEQDIVAAIEYIYAHSGHKVIVVGSSYSASLALKIAKINDKVQAVAAFSPGEYFNGMDLEKEIAGLNVPVFATSSKKESADVTKLLAGVESKTIFVPTAEGDHGSKVLWESSPAHDEYWAAFTAFIKGTQTL